MYTSQEVTTVNHLRMSRFISHRCRMVRPMVLIYLFRLCSACGIPMQGAFVRALGTVFHMRCFTCMVYHPQIFPIVLSLIPRQDCGEVVASKFFPIEGPDGKQNPLCERDYFRRLNLVCGKCGMALRGSYISACGQFPPPSVCIHSFFSTFPASSAPQTKNTTLNILLAPSALPFLAHRTLTMNTTAMYTAISTTQSASPQNAPAAHAPSSNSLSK